MVPEWGGLVIVPSQPLLNLAVLFLESRDGKRLKGAANFVRRH